MPPRHTTPLLLTTLTLLIAACGEGAGDRPSYTSPRDQPPLTTPTPEPPPDDPRADTDTDGDGLTDQVERRIGTDPARRDQACVEARYVHEPERVARPLDVILVVDNSGSMSEEISALRRDLAQTFAAPLRDPNSALRLLVISAYREAPGVLPLCLSGQAFGGPCGQVTPPRTARFAHYEREINSVNSMSALLATLRAPDPHALLPTGWLGWLRQGSDVAIVEVSDDRSDMSAAGFEASLRELAPGLYSPRARITWHSISGMNALGVRLPSHPLNAAPCETAAEGGAQTQLLSINTGGLRFSICETGSYAALFERTLTHNAGEIPCHLPLPWPNSSALRPAASRAAAQWRLRPGAPYQALRFVDDASACSGADSYWVERGEAPGDAALVLCPTTCAAIQDAREPVTLRVLAGCEDARCDNSITHLSCDP